MATPELLTALGAALAIFLSSAGSAYGSAHSGCFSVRAFPTLGYKGLIPVIISGVLAIYGLIIGYLLICRLDNESEISETEGYRYLASGLLVGCATLSSGFGIGTFMRPPGPPRGPPPHFMAPPVPHGAEVAVPLLGKPPVPPIPPHAENFVTTVLVLIFLEAIGLYGLVVALFAMGKN